MNLQENTRRITQKMYDLFDSPIKEIMSRTEFSRPTITKFFKLESIRPDTEEKIYELCLDLIEEKEAKREALIHRSNTILA